MPRKLAIVGAGPMGLAAAYYAAKRGLSVEVLEAAPVAGGMAVHFDFDGLSIERFYHFCCLGDVDTLELMDELGLEMRWRTTRMGYFVDGRLFRWGDPFSLATFPHLDPVQKLRYGLLAFLSTRRSDWRRLDEISARDWLIAWCGRRAYDKVWRPLLELKFYEHTGSISAAWLWQRVNRLGRSRKSLFQEQLGHIEGGSEALVNGLVGAIERMGGRVRLGASVERILIRGGAVAGVRLQNGELVEADEVISTAPLPRVPGLLACEPRLAERYQGFQNVGVVCVILKLAKSVSPNFWVNVSDERMAIPGFVEFSNLREAPQTIVYTPYYMPVTNPKFGSSDQAFIDESFGYLRLVNPALAPADLVAGAVGRLRHAQPVCDVGFAARLPAAKTEVAGLQIADTSFYYPEDRGVSESISYAKKLVAELTP